MKIILDVDGVLADFASAASRVHKRTNPYSIPENFGKYNMEQIWGMPVSEFVAPLDYDFWANLPLMEHAHSIANHLIQFFGPHNICILTKPVPTYGCLEGKRDWLNKHFPHLMSNWMIGTNKTFTSHVNSLLIDDNERHCYDFQQAGGRAFLVPACWNFKYFLADDPATSLLEYIQELRKQGLIL